MTLVADLRNDAELAHDVFAAIHAAACRINPVAFANLRATTPILFADVIARALPNLFTWSPNLYNYVTYTDGSLVLIKCQSGTFGRHSDHTATFVGKGRPVVMGNPHSDVLVGVPRRRSIHGNAEDYLMVVDVMHDLMIGVAPYEEVEASFQTNGGKNQTEFYWSAAQWQNRGVLLKNVRKPVMVDEDADARFFAAMVAFHNVWLGIDLPKPAAAVPPKKQKCPLARKPAARKRKAA